MLIFVLVEWTTLNYRLVPISVIHYHILVEGATLNYRLVLVEGTTLNNRPLAVEDNSYQPVTVKGDNSHLPT